MHCMGSVICWSCDTRYRQQAVVDVSAALAQAANYLNIKSLLDLTCQTVANMIKGAIATCCCAARPKH